MKRIAGKGTRILMLGLVMGACSDDRSRPGAGGQPGAGREAPTSRFDESCAVVLAEIPAVSDRAATDRLDGRIARYQARLRRSMARLADLERLGWAFVAKARTESDPGYYHLADEAARCIEAQRPQTPEALLLRGHVLHNLHRFREAEVLARELVQRRGSWLDFGLLGDVVMEQGRLDEAVDAYQRMMDQRPGPQVYTRAAHVRWLKGDLSGAVEMTRMAARATGSRDPELAAWVRVRLARYLRQSGDTAEAAHLIAAALRLQPDYAPALLAQGRLLLAQDQPAQAVPLLTRAVHANPLPDYQWTLLEALRQLGHIEDARAVEAELLAKGASADRRTFAVFLATTGKDPAQALHLSRQELEVRRDPFTLDAMSWALRASGRVREARMYSRLALAEGTQDARLLFHAGVIAAADGAWEQSAQWLASARSLAHMLLPSERAQLKQATTSGRNARQNPIGPGPRTLPAAGPGNELASRNDIGRNRRSASSNGEVGTRPSKFEIPGS